MIVAASILFGLILLAGGGDLLVRGAVQIAERLGMSPMLIGITLVGFGTSTPELVTSVQASLSGAPNIAIGNIVGSNIANILVVIGATALLQPIRIEPGALRRDATVLMASAIIFALLSALLPLDRIIGAVFVLCLVGYIVYCIRDERAAGSEQQGALASMSEGRTMLEPGLIPQPSKLPSPVLSVVFVLAGLAGLILGGKLLVSGSVSLAEMLGVPDTIIGLTIVAIGTSAPEIATSLVAAFRKQTEVAFGNVVGSNIYNLLFIGGATAIATPVVVPQQIVTFDNPVMIAATAALVVFAWSGLRIGRREGGILLAGYGAYLVALILL